MATDKIPLSLRTAVVAWLWRGSGQKRVKRKAERRRGVAAAMPHHRLSARVCAACYLFLSLAGAQQAAAASEPRGVSVL